MDPRLVAAAALAAIGTALIAQPPAAGSGDPRPAIASADLLLRAGRSKTILHVPKVGWWTATCGRDGKVAIDFVADQLLPSSDIVVSRSSGAPIARRVGPHHRVKPDPPLEVVSQHWQIAPFASAQVRVTSADVAGRVVDESCMTSVVAVTGPDQGPTREG
jgi:hypothetical protein